MGNLKIPDESLGFRVKVLAALPEDTCIDC